MATTEELAAKAKELLEAGFGKAKEVLKSNDSLNGLIGSARTSLDSNDVAQDVMDSVVTLISMIEDYANGSYMEVPTKSIIAVVSAIIYWVAPLDFIPDAIPLAGKVDDTAVIAACIALIGDDMNDYKEWKQVSVTE